MELEPFDPAAVSDVDWADCYALHSAAHREQGTEAPSLRAYVAARRSAPPSKRRRSWVARDAGRVVAKIDFWHEGGASAVFSLYVLPTHRQRGVARGLLEAASTATETEALDSVITGAITETGCNLCARFGGRLVQRGVYQRLAVDGADTALLERLRADGSRRSPRAEVLELEQLPDELADGYLALHRSVSASVAAQGALSIEPLTLEQRRATERALQRDGGRWLTLLIRDANGAFIAMTEALHDRERPGLLRQELTGVLPEHRGQGLAQWLKAELVLRARTRFPELTSITTHNLEHNAPMLAINRRIGFRPTAVQSTYSFPIDRLRTPLR